MKSHLLFWLVAGHFICDYVLQGDTMAREKNEFSKTDLQKHVPWYYWMVAHASTHGAAVALITGRVDLGWYEAALHGVIDIAKCRKKINIHVDQVLHLAAKLLWLCLAVFSP
jgi:hypothetical protein